MGKTQLLMLRTLTGLASNSKVVFVGFLKGCEGEIVARTYVIVCDRIM